MYNQSACHSCSLLKLNKKPFSFSRWSSSTTSTTTSSPLFEAVLKETKEKQEIQQTLKLDSKPELLKSTHLQSTATHLKKFPIYSTPTFKGSYKKVNHLTRLIQGMSVAQAKVQMEMNLKRPATHVAELLARVQTYLTRDHQLNPHGVFIKRAWVGKGQYTKTINMHGRGRFGIMHHPKSHVKIEITPGPFQLTREEKDFEKLKKLYKKPLHLPRALVETVPMRFHEPIWSKKPWKYVTSPKWTDPNCVLRRDLEE